MIKRQLLSTTGILLFLLFPFIVFSQNQKKASGYYINLKGDTIVGTFTDYNEWTHSPTNVDFVPTANGNGNAIILTPVNCRFFNVDDRESYIAYLGNRLINPTDIGNDANEIDSSDKLEPVSAFLRIIFSNNEFKLAILSDKKRENFFYQTNKDPLIELIYKSYINSNSAFEISTYKDQISNLFSQKITGKELSRNINELNYSEPGFLCFLQSIYKTKGDKKTKKRYRNSYFVTGGIAINSFKVSGGSDDHPVGLNYGSSTSPVLSFGIIMPFQRNFGKIFFSPQVKIFSFKNSGTFTGPYNTTYNTEVYTFKNDLAISLLAYFGYNIVQNKNLIWRLAAGVGANALINNRLISQTNFYAQDQIKTFSPIAFPLNLQTSITINKRLMILADYTLPTNVTGNYMFQGKYSSLQVTVGWVF